MDIKLFNVEHFKNIKINKEIYNFLLEKVKEKYIVNYILNLSYIQELNDYKEKLEIKYLYNWKKISNKENLSEDFIYFFKEKIYFKSLSFNRNIKLSKEFIINNVDLLNWNGLSIFQNLNYKEITDKFNKKIDWDNYSKYQNVTVNIIIDNIDKINWNNLIMNNHITKEFNKKLRYNIKKIGGWKKLMKKFNFTNNQIKNLKYNVHIFEFSRKQIL